MIFDTHCHYNDESFDQDREDLLRSLPEKGVDRICEIGYTPESSEKAIQLAKTYADSSLSIHSVVGIHPEHAAVWSPEATAKIEALSKEKEVVAIGEIGLDFYDKSQTAAQRECQQKLFVRQLVLAESLKRRVVVHNLKSSSAATAAIVEAGFGQGGIIHAFSGSAEEASAFVRLGFKIGIGSLLLNPSARKIRKVVQALDLRDMVLETDSPFMLKNEVNTPANVRRIAETVAQLRGIAVEEVAAQTERNADGLLEYRKGLPDEPELI